MDQNEIEIRIEYEKALATWWTKRVDELFKEFFFNGIKSMQQTINYDDDEITVHFWYQPYEPPERGPEAQYPGCPEEIEIDRIEDVDGADVTDRYSQADMEQIVNVLLAMKDET